MQAAGAARRTRRKALHVADTIACAARSPCVFGRVRVLQANVPEPIFSLWNDNEDLLLASQAPTNDSRRQGEVALDAIVSHRFCSG